MRKISSAAVRSPPFFMNSSKKLIFKRNSKHPFGLRHALWTMIETPICFTVWKRPSNPMRFILSSFAMGCFIFLMCRVSVPSFFVMAASRGSAYRPPRNRNGRCRRTPAPCRHVQDVRDPCWRDSGWPVRAAARRGHDEASVGSNGFKLHFGDIINRGLRCLTPTLVTLIFRGLRCLTPILTPLIPDN